MSDSVRPHRGQPTRLSRPWDSPGKNTGVGCHFLLQCMKVKSESEVAQSCPTLRDPMDCSLPGSSVHGILQSRVLEWGAIAFSVNLYVASILKNAWLLLSIVSALFIVSSHIPRMLGFSTLSTCLSLSFFLSFSHFLSCFLGCDSLFIPT